MPPCLIRLFLSLFLSSQGYFLKRQYPKKQVLGVFVSLMGVFVILTRLDIAIIQNLTINKGDLWMLLAALDWALYSIFLKYLRPEGLSPLPFLGIMVIIGTIVLFPLFLLNPFNEVPIIWNDGMIKAIAYIAIFPFHFCLSGMELRHAKTGGRHGWAVYSPHAIVWRINGGDIFRGEHPAVSFDWWCLYCTGAVAQY